MLNSENNLSLAPLIVLANQSDSVAYTLVSDDIAQADATGLLDQAKTLFATEGEELMFIMDVPYVPAQQTSIVLAGRPGTAENATQQPSYILKECQEMPSVGDPRSAQRVVDPAAMLRNYIQGRDNHYVDLSAFKNPTLLKGTTNGVIFAEIDNAGFKAFHYDPALDYIGKDSAIFMVEYQGKYYKIVVDFIVSRGPDENRGLCHEPKLIKIKKPTSGSSSYDLNGLEVGVANLAHAALAQTSGTSITLDANAAGYGWFIDATPGLNEEFLPTADPTVWKAKAGSAAEGKMDMLSVLLHEYGHALGLDHSADAHSSMAATLQPGVRRTLSADDQLALMKLTGYFPAPDGPSDPFSPFLGSPLLLGSSRLRGSFGGLALTPTLSQGERGYCHNTKLLQTPPLPTPSSRAVLAGPPRHGFTGSGAAVLTESATAQTRLNQLFVLGEHDRFLRFTLADIALDDVNSAPDDAFEVALIDANTGLSLLGGTGLTRSDALLNLQANGTEYRASAVTSTLNADGTRTYLVDLAGVAAGTVASLSFDLIGFGRGTAATASCHGA